jgi:branched-chain amino acid transport system substrate-binding protein
MVQAGLDIPVAPTSGNQSFPQMEQWADFLPKGLVMGSALFPEHDGVLTLDPRVEAAQHDMYAVLKERGLKADNMEATSWDAGLIVIAALKAVGPNATAEQVRQYIANLTNFAGVDGIYDFKANPERGLGPDSAIVVRYDAKAKAWAWLTKPGGEPLK